MTGDAGAANVHLDVSLTIPHVWHASEALAEALHPDEAERAGRRVLRDNALALYRL